jgi:two-component system chemotaxis sensor kinase CheA
MEFIGSKTILEIKDLQNTFTTSTEKLMKNVLRYEKIMKKSDKRQQREYDELQHKIIEVEDLSKNLEIKVKQRTQQLAKEKENVQVLLNNAGQGFLYFDKNMIIGAEYSKKARKIFNQDIKDQDITKLLYKDDEPGAEFFKITLQGILQDDELRQEILISLLKNEFNINGVFIEVEYKVLDKNNFMMILTDITAKKILAQRIKDEQQVLKMVVEVVITKEQFQELINDYELFIDKIESYKSSDVLIELRREIHTFKGLFAQKEMLYIVKKLHDFETILDNSIKLNKFDPSIKTITKSDMKQWLDLDLVIIKGILGADYFLKSNSIEIEQYRLEQLNKKVSKYLENNDKKLIKEISRDVENLKYHNIKIFFRAYEKLVSQLALKLDKQINPLILETEDIYISSKYVPFINSLVHIFRNSVDHGIES